MNRFLFDTEFIYKASAGVGCTIKDMPADLRDNVHLPNMRRGGPCGRIKELIFNRLERVGGLQGC